MNQCVLDILFDYCELICTNDISLFYTVSSFLLHYLDILYNIYNHCIPLQILEIHFTAQTINYHEPN